MHVHCAIGSILFARSSKLIKINLQITDKGL